MDKNYIYLFSGAYPKILFGKIVQIYKSKMIRGRLLRYPKIKKRVIEQRALVKWILYAATILKEITDQKWETMCKKGELKKGLKQKNLF